MSNQDEFDELLGKYNSGIEPLENWVTTDLVKLIDAADAELQNRAPPDADVYPHTQIDEGNQDSEIADEDY